MIAQVEAYRYNDRLFETKEKAEEFQKGDRMLDKIKQVAPTLGEVGQDQTTIIVLGRLLKDKANRRNLIRLIDAVEEIWEEK